jgi:hypothetical protein
MGQPACRLLGQAARSISRPVGPTYTFVDDDEFGD